MQTLAKTRRQMSFRKNLKRRLRKSPVSAGRRRLVVLQGGPIASLMMHSPGTLPFSLDGMIGYYNMKNEWVEI